MAPPGHRKVAFSHKQKKEQLKEKKERKKDEIRDEFGVVDHRAMKKKRAIERQEDGGKRISVRKINQQPDGQTSTKGYDPNRYRLHFKSDSNEEVEKGKASSREPLVYLNEDACEIDLDEIYKPGTVLDMPKRPLWDYSLTKEQLNAREERYFKNYLDKLFEQYENQEMSYFELNLETWRQLWRVLEMSDVVLLITDIRHPALHFSPALYDFVVNELKKHIILVLNKVDLAPPSLVVAWKDYFQKKFPQVSIVCFTSMPKDESERKLINANPTEVLFKKRRRRNFTAVGPKQLLLSCEKIVQGKVDLSSWKQKIEYDAELESDSSDDDDDEDEEEEEGDATKEMDDVQLEQYQFCQDSILTIGCCGYPNVGKSSIINGLVGKKVVSVSKTPGHTKHFQTIFLTRNVKLCDSPGLVFPSLVKRPLQILSGIFPISQLREPYTTIRYLAERLPLPQLLKLNGDGSGLWSAYSICDAWAEKRGFLTAKAARNDVYRAANHLLRLAVEGRLCLCMKPPGYCLNKVEWEAHAETEEILKLQEMHRGVTTYSKDEEIENESSEDDSDESDMHVAASNPFQLLSDD